MTTPKKPKAHPEDAAKAVFRMTTRKPADLVVSTSQLLENVNKHPQYLNTPAMQQAVTTMSSITATLATQDTDIQTARTGLVALLAARQLTTHSFMRARRSLLAGGGTKSQQAPLPCSMSGASAPRRLTRS